VDRCALFVDAGYVLADGAMAVHGTRRRDSVSWDYAGLVKLLTGMSRDRTGLPVLRCYWYEATVEGRPSAEHNTLADLPGVKLRLGRVRPGRREGVAAEMHRDLTTLARNRAVSDVVILSPEEDLTEVVAEVQDLGLRVVIAHIAAGGNWTVPRPLRQECDDIVEISGAHLRPFVDLIAAAEPADQDDQYRNGNYQRRSLANGHGGSLGAMTHQGLPAAALPPPPAAYAPVDYQRTSDGASQPAAAAQSQTPAAPQSQVPGPAQSPAAPQSQVSAPAQAASAAPQPQSAPQPQVPAQPQARAQSEVSAPPADVSHDLAAAPAPAPAQAPGPAQHLPPPQGQPAIQAQPAVQAQPPVQQAQPPVQAQPPAQAQPVSLAPAQPAATLHAPAQAQLAAAAQVPAQPQHPAVPQAPIAGPPALAAPQVPQAAAASLPLAAPTPQVGYGQLPGGQLPGGSWPQDGAATAGRPGSPGPQFPPQAGQGGSRFTPGPGDYRSPDDASSAPGRFGEPAERGRFTEHPPQERFAEPTEQRRFGEPAEPGRFAEHPQQPGRFGEGPPPGRFAEGPASGRFAEPLPPGRFAEGPPPGRFGDNSGSAQYSPGPPGLPAPPGAFGAGNAEQAPYPPQFPGSQPGQHGASALESRYSTPQHEQGPYSGPQSAAHAALQPPVPQPVAISLADAVQAAHAEGFGFGDAVARDAPALWLEAVLARKPRMPSDLEARLLQGSALPIDSLLHDEVRHSLRRGFWDALERSRR
jgi:hypothetical protein